MEEKKESGVCKQEFPSEKGGSSLVSSLGLVLDDSVDGLIENKIANNKKSSGRPETACHAHWCHLAFCIGVCMFSPCLFGSSPATPHKFMYVRSISESKL